MSMLHPGAAGRVDALTVTAGKGFAVHIVPKIDLTPYGIPSNAAFHLDTRESSAASRRNLMVDVRAARGRSATDPWDEFAFEPAGQPLPLVVRTGPTASLRLRSTTSINVRVA